VSRPLASGDRVGNGDGTQRHVAMQQLDHLAFEPDHGTALVFGQIEGGDDLASPLYLGRLRLEHHVGRRSLVRMNDGLPIEAERAALQALATIAFHVPEVVPDARTSMP
jgi:hypothetical protein